MSGKYRIGLVLFSLLGLGASIAALYVHYRLVMDPAYSSFCDVNATVSCEQVLESSYGRIFGIPVAAGGAIWSGLVLLLSWYGMRQPASETARRSAGYVFVLATVGLAAVFYFAYASFFVLRQACPLCMTMYVSVVAIFLLSAAAAGSLRDLPGRLASDLAGLRTSPTAATLAAVWLVASLALVVFFPQQQTVNAQAAEEQQAALPTETLDANQTAEWHQWLDRQVPVTEPAVLPSGPVKVLVVKFNDFQCPACRSAWIAYHGIFEKYEKQYPMAFEFQNKDYPLESECGMGGAHQFACESAVAVRLAAEKGKAGDMETWLFNSQDQLSREHVKRGVQEVAGVSSEEYESRYAKVAADIRTEAALGSKLGVNSTPTFFINGVRVPGLRPAYFDAAIAYLLQKSGATS
jgi:uncharacterized membrane protein/protein-disulfide isomerase